MANLLAPGELMYRKFEPKLENRFYILTVNQHLPGFIIKKAARPKPDTAIVTVDHINVQHYYKGKTVWKPISIELYDPISPSGARSVMDWLIRSHESTTGRDGYASFYQENVTINILGPVGDIIEEWTLVNAWAGGSFDFGNLDWATENNLVNITFDIIYDYAILNY